MRLSNMPRLAATNFLAIVLLTLLVGCKDIATFTLAPYPDVSVTAVVHKVSYHDFEIPGKTTFVHFKYTVTVRSDVPVYFKVGNISTSLNGVKTKEAYYDTIASIAPHWQKMKKGENAIEVYVVFPGAVDISAIPNLQFINYGLSREIKNGE